MREAAFVSIIVRLLKVFDHLCHGSEWMSSFIV
jgi:hypothetical protein